VREVEREADIYREKVRENVYKERRVADREKERVEEVLFGKERARKKRKRT
jgi:hypothetical protein